MRKFLLTGLSFIPISLLGQGTATFTASVTIVEPVTITTLTNLSFSEVRAGTGGVVTLTADGLRNGLGGVELGEGGNISPASFNISGKPGTKVNLKLPVGEHLLSNGNQNIIIKDFSTNWSLNDWLKEENNILKVGASIVVEAGQEPGYYTSVQPLEIIMNYD